MRKDFTEQDAKQQEDLLLLIRDFRSANNDSEKNKIFIQVLKLTETLRYSAIYTKVVKAQEPEDLLSMLEFVTFQALEKYDERQGRFAGYVYKAYLNTINTQIKVAHQRQHDRLNRAVSISSVLQKSGEETSGIDIDPKPSPLQNLVTAEDTELAIRNCTKLEREIFKSLLSGSSYVEISEETGYSLKTIDNALVRIRRKAKQGKLLDTGYQEYVTTHRWRKRYQM